jgi:hypothetical protein
VNSVPPNPPLDKRMSYVVKATASNGRITWLAAPSELTRAYMFGSREMAQVFATKADAQHALQLQGPTEFALSIELAK